MMSCGTGWSATSSTPTNGTTPGAGPLARSRRASRTRTPGAAGASVGGERDGCSCIDCGCIDRGGHPLSIDIANESGVAVSEVALAAVARHVLDRLRIHPLAELSVLLVGEDAMADLYQRWMGEPGPTDVLAFPMDELRPPHLVGGRAMGGGGAPAQNDVQAAGLPAQNDVPAESHVPAETEGQADNSGPGEDDGAEPPGEVFGGREGPG